MRFQEGICIKVCMYVIEMHNTDLGTPMFDTPVSPRLETFHPTFNLGYVSTNYPKQWSV